MLYNQEIRVSKPKLFKILFSFILLALGFIAGYFFKKEKIVAPIPDAKVEEPKILECEDGRCPVYTSMRLDGDGDEESVVQIQTAMTQGFGKVLIIDNGKIVFDSGEKMRIGINQTREQAASELGFTLWYGTKINSNEGVSISYTYEDGQYVPIPTPTPTPTPSPPSMDLSYYENIFKERQELVIEPVFVDLNGDSKDEIVYTNIGEGCGSCHAKYFHIFTGKKEIFYAEFDDPTFTPLDNGFEVKEPDRTDGAPYCCPTSYQYSTYIWNGNSFQKK